MNENAISEHTAVLSHPVTQEEIDRDINYYETLKAAEILHLASANVPACFQWIVKEVSFMTQEKCKRSQISSVKSLDISELLPILDYLSILSNHIANLL